MSGDLLARGFQRGTVFPFVWGVQRGLRSPLTGRIQRNRWFRGTRFSVGKSSVLYLCFRLTLERDWLRHLLCGQIAGVSHFSAAVGQADFVRTRTKSGFAHRAKSACTEKEAEVYQSPRPAAAKRTNTTTAVPARDCPALTPRLTLHGSH